jgi:nucleotide-binding universal stress UspA family protein
MIKSPDVLVPVDFSPCAANAVRVAVGVAEPDGDLTLLHVIDQSIVTAATAAALGTEEEVTARLRENAEASFASMLEGLDTKGISVERMIVFGEPFIEILKIARDLDLPLIVMGMRGRSTPSQTVLLGSTAERVLCGAHVPVLCVPC